MPPRFTDALMTFLSWFNCDWRNYVLPCNFRTARWKVQITLYALRARAKSVRCLTSLINAINASEWTSDDESDTTVPHYHIAPVPVLNKCTFTTTTAITFFHSTGTIRTALDLQFTKSESNNIQTCIHQYIFKYYNNMNNVFMRFYKFYS